MTPDGRTRAARFLSEEGLKVISTSYVYKPPGRQIDRVAEIAQELSLMANRPIGVSHSYEAAMERLLAEYERVGCRLLYEQLQPYLSKPLKR